MVAVSRKGFVFAADTAGLTHGGAVGGLVRRAVVPEPANAATIGAMVLTARLHGLPPRWSLLQHLVLISAAIFTATVKLWFHLLPHLLL